MARPKKDPLAPKKPKVFDVAKLPLSPGRVVLFRYPLGGLTSDEIEFIKRYLALLELREQGELFEYDDEEDEDEARERRLEAARKRSAPHSLS